MAALCVSGLNRGYEGPVGTGGVEQALDLVMLEVHHSEHDPLDLFRQIVHGLATLLIDGPLKNKIGKVSDRRVLVRAVARRMIDGITSH